MLDDNSGGPGPEESGGIKSESDLPASSSSVPMDVESESSIASVGISPQATPDRPRDSIVCGWGSWAFQRCFIRLLLEATV